MRAAPRSSSWVMVTVLALSGCQSLPEVPRETRVPTPVPCIAPADVPQRPALRTQAELLSLDSHRRTHAAWSDLTRLRAYVGELEAVVHGCSRIPPLAR